MGAAAPFIGKLIVSVLVSKAVAVVGEKIGLSESMSGVIGMAVGLYAGSLVGSPTPSTTTTSTIGADLDAGMGGSDFGASMANPADAGMLGQGVDVAGGPTYGSFGATGLPNTGPPGMTPQFPNTPPPGTPGINPVKPPEPQGMLDSGGGGPTVTPGGTSTADAMVKAGTGNAAIQPQQSWFQKLMTPDNVLAGIGQVDKNNQANYRTDKFYEERENDRAGWRNSPYANQGTLYKPQLNSPSQG